MSLTHRPERREFGRRAARISGWIHIGIQPRIPCIVSDISPKGARLSFSPGISIPDRFVLRLGDAVEGRLCEVRHGHQGDAGVQFVDTANSLTRGTLVERVLAWWTK